MNRKTKNSGRSGPVIEEEDSGSSSGSGSSSSSSNKSSKNEDDLENEGHFFKY